MGAVRLEAIQSLATAIGAAVPGLEIITGQPIATQGLCLPSLSILVTAFRFLPNQEEDLAPDPELTTYVAQVGDFEATVQLRLESATPGERYDIEERLSGLFLERQGSPGVLVTSVADADFGTFIASWELDETEWHDAMAFDSQQGSVLTLTAIVPALVRRVDVPTIEHLLAAFTEEMTQAFNTDTLLPPAVEVFEINEDGTIS